VIFLAIVSANLFAQKIDQPKSQFFIENKGQWDNQVQYLARLGGLNLWSQIQVSSMIIIK